MEHEKERTNYHTGEVETVNDNFVQLYVDKLDLIVEMTRENPTAVQMFTWLLKHMDKRNALIVSQHALSEALGMHRTTVHRCTVYLQAKKALAVFKSGNVNIYAINAQIAWKSDARGKKYALFDAAVYIAQSEQEKPLYDTQLVGIAVEKKSKRKMKTGQGPTPKETELGFREMNKSLNKTKNIS
ncbi:replication protein (plasmid) [Fibrisoma limi BUZ 3]|uniref:Replication protein n=1 Tax=Fibrisoma limi BUZ 3 TaxID=1185876 RepID=I2GUA1_9BACT|nr:replication/maintenance protein RepL [Fibrisoma limi]CCH57702.1 replication protein [Fibrisoma limi BUZ 3]